ncbi:MAG: hypothetical protein PF501_17070 [Salinisphaera sp.]|jgi:hypothetical protein|nr:hypothetical protein [Salinisphaera sp.]
MQIIVLLRRYPASCAGDHDGQVVFLRMIQEAVKASCSSAQSIHIWQASKFQSALTDHDAKRVDAQHEKNDLEPIEKHRQPRI